MSDIEKFTCYNCLYYMDLQRYRDLGEADSIEEYLDMKETCTSSLRQIHLENDVSDGHVSTLDCDHGECKFHELRCDRMYGKEKASEMQLKYLKERIKMERENEVISKDDIAEMFGGMDFESQPVPK